MADLPTFFSKIFFFVLHAIPIYIQSNKIRINENQKSTKEQNKCTSTLQQNIAALHLLSSRRFTQNWDWDKYISAVGHISSLLVSSKRNQNKKKINFHRSAIDSVCSMCTGLLATNFTTTRRCHCRCLCIGRMLLFAFDTAFWQLRIPFVVVAKLTAETIVAIHFCAVNTFTSRPTQHKIETPRSRRMFAIKYFHFAKQIKTAHGLRLDYNLFWLLWVDSSEKTSATFCIFTQFIILAISAISSYQVVSPNDIQINRTRSHHQSQ